ncbi:MAG: hypothetical protein AAF432_02720 [Planctomycetota bacterium]
MTRVRIVNMATDGASQARQAWAVAQRQPSWVTKVAAVTFMLVIALPLLLLLVLAIAMAVVVFIVLGLVAAVVRGVRGVLPRQDGRENVVVRRRE